MRFEVRFSNGYWKLFDTNRYASVAVFGELRYALDACEWENRQLMDIDASGQDGNAPGS